MNLAARAYLGAVAGALVVLLLHPRSRPYLLSSSLWPTTAKAIKANPSLPENIGKLSVPLSVSEASVWLQTGAEVDLSGRKLTEEQYITLAEIAQRGEQAEPDNAFWPQMKSVFIGKALSSIGKGKELTIQAWLRASRLSTWDDHQTPRLDKISGDLAKQTGASFAWQQAVAYSRRSSAVGQRLLRHSRQLESENPKDVRIKVANVRNGSLIREGGKSIAACYAGATMVDMAGIRHPGSVGAGKVTAKAYGEILQNVPVTDLAERNQLVLSFLLNQAWSAYVPVRDSSQRAIDITRQSILYAVLPTALLLAGMVGITAFIAGHYVVPTQIAQRVLSPPFVIGIGLVAALIVFLVTKLIFASLWALVVMTLFSISSDRVKSGRVTGLGVVFQTTIATLAALVAVALVIHLIEASATEQLLAKAAALPAGTNMVPLQLVLLGVSMVIATAPAWGFFYRYEPKAVLPESLRSFGAYLGVGAMTLTVVAAPICLVADQRLHKDLKQMVQNEPNHYLSRTSEP